MALLQAKRLSSLSLVLTTMSKHCRIIGSRWTSAFRDGLANLFSASTLASTSLYCFQMYSMEEYMEELAGRNNGTKLSSISLSVTL